MTVSSIFETAISGLNAAGRQAHVAANNIVNINTDGFTPSEVRQSTVYASPGRASGVQAEVFDTERTDAGREGSLVRDFITLIAAREAYAANIATIETADRLSRDSIDLLA